MNLKKSPLAPENFPKLPLVKGMLMGTARSQVKYKKRDDIQQERFIESLVSGQLIL